MELPHKIALISSFRTVRRSDIENNLSLKTVSASVTVVSSVGLDVAAGVDASVAVDADVLCSEKLTISTFLSNSGMYHFILLNGLCSSQSE